MRKIINSVLLLFFLGLFIFFSFSTLMPKPDFSTKQSDSVFSTKRAFQHVKRIARAPHYLGAKNHSKVRNYIVSELQDLGLTVHTQSAYVMNQNRVLTRPENIVTRLQGSDPQPGSDLLVMAHYDSDPHSSFGASDDGSGVATILESLRAFLAKEIAHKNNIIICITDAEEIGLLGAQLFSDQHDWADNIGVVLNFEARGTSGPSNTILETNHGNAKLVKAFAQAHPEFPMASSLMYEIYAQLPNDTDASVFRKDRDIPTFFFAFIDGHYNYHSATDIPENMSRKSLAHQGSYLMALMPYFGNLKLSNLETEKKQIYFNFPLINVVHYRYAWILPLLILAWLLFLTLVIAGYRRQKLNWKSMGKGGLAFGLCLIICGLVGYFGWQLLMQIYPQYGEIQQGFPYNGHTYISAFITFALFVFFGLYHRFAKITAKTNLLAAPLLLWLLINTGLAFGFKGASFFIIPVLFMEIAFALMIFTKKPLGWLMLLLSLPAIFILVPLVVFIPVALGTKVIFASLLFTIFIGGLLLPLFQLIPRKDILAWLSLLISVAFFMKAHIHSQFSKDRPKPNSLVYTLDINTQEAYWNTYDHILDDWTKHYINEKDTTEGEVMMLESKYGENFTYSYPAPLKVIPYSQIKTQQDSTDLMRSYYSMTISPRRSINRLELFSKKAAVFEDFRANGILAGDFSKMKSKIKHLSEKKSNRLLTYYAVDRDVLRISFSLPNNLHPQLEVVEVGYHLLDNPWLDVPKRESWMMPRPFVVNDAIVTKQDVRF